MLNFDRMQRLQAVLNHLTAAIYPNPHRGLTMGQMIKAEQPNAFGYDDRFESSAPNPTLVPVSGTVVFHYKQGDTLDEVVQVVTMTLTDGEWQVVLTDPPKRPGRKPRQKPSGGTVQGAKGQVDPDRQARAKKAAATRKKNREAKATQTHDDDGNQTTPS